MIPAVLLVALIVLTGCSRITLHPILKSDITRMPVGESYIPEKDGWFLSDEYVEEVMKVRVGE